MSTFSLFGDKTEETEVQEASSPSSISTPRKRKEKSKSAYRTISEVAKELGVATHVLRFWETKFDEVQPMTRGGGRRYYRPEDVDLLKQIQALLYDEGYTIKGVQSYFKKLKKGEVDPVELEGSGEGLDVSLAAEMLSELEEIREILA